MREERSWKHKVFIVLQKLIYLIVLMEINAYGLSFDDKTKKHTYSRLLKEISVVNNSSSNHFIQQTSCN